MLLGQAEPRVEQVTRSEARVLNGNARKDKCRALRCGSPTRCWPNGRHASSSDMVY